MDLSFPSYKLPSSTETLRQEVRAFIDEELTAGRWQRRGDFASHYDADFSARLGARGWLGMTWPKQFGGHERSTLERLTVTEELLAANAPVAAHWIADRQSGPLLLRYGTPAQCEEFLPAIARGESFYSIGMSEPDSGSDLASVRTRAEAVDDGWILNGRKVWTTYAHRNHFAIVLARTGDAGESRHEGLTQFVVDLRAKDLAVRPIRNMAGADEFNEVVFDDTFVPASRVIGAPGNGWSQVTSELAFERSGPDRYLSSIRLIEAAASVARSVRDPALLKALGKAGAKLVAFRAMSIAVAVKLQQGEMPNLEAALIKDLGNSFEREQIQVFRRLQDLSEDNAEWRDALAECLLNSPSWTLRGGTREILRGMVARGLGLR